MKKTKKYFVFSLLSFLLIFALCTPMKGSAAHKKGLVKEDGKVRFYKHGKRIVSKWKTVDGDTYYFNSHGNAYVGSHSIEKQYYIFKSNGKLYKCKSSKFTEVDGQKYLADQDGKAVKGWKIIDDKLYHMNKKGKADCGKTVEGIYLNKNGYANNDIGKVRLKMKAMTIINAITNSRMSDYEKLRAAFRYMSRYGNFHYAMKYPNLSKPDWFRITARDMFNTRRGNCYSFACGFATLAYEIGYKPVIICGRVSGSRDGASDGLTRHSWVMINGRHFDPEAQFAGWKPGVFNLSYYSIRHTIQRRVSFNYYKFE